MVSSHYLVSFWSVYLVQDLLYFSKKREQLAMEMRDGERTQVILMAGYAGSGKSTFAHWMVKQTSISMIAKDTIKLNLLDQGAPWDMAGWEAYIELLSFIKRYALEGGQSLIVDCSNEHQFVYQDVLHAVYCLHAYNASRVSIKVVLCVTPRGVREARVNQRGSVFAPHWMDLPNVGRDEEMVQKFGHLFSEEEQLERELDEIVSSEAKMRHFLTFSRGNTLVVNTTEDYRQGDKWTWGQLQSFLLK